MQSPSIRTKSNFRSIDQTKNKISPQSETSLSFSKIDRLILDRDYRVVFDAAHRKSQSHSQSAGAVQRAGHFLIYRSFHEERPRIGFSISRKVLRRAHDRNRVRRCVKEFFRLHRSLFAGDLVVRLSTAPKAYDFESLTLPLRQLLERSR